MKVLVAEDSKPIRRSVCLALRQSGYVVDEAADGDEALWSLQFGSYDAAVLDIMMPGMDGREVLRTIRKEGAKVPVLFLTAKDAVRDRVEGLSLGADDYLVKPFAIDELIARVGVLCRRNYGAVRAEISIGDLVVDTVAKTAVRNGRSIHLRAREFRLLEYLARRRGEVVTRTDIEEHIYDELVSPSSNVVDSSIYALRKALGKPSLVQTRRGQGYVLAEVEK